VLIAKVLTIVPREGFVLLFHVLSCCTIFNGSTKTTCKFFIQSFFFYILVKPYSIVGSTMAKASNPYPSMQHTNTT
jgi:hypothetical protein